MYFMDMGDFQIVSSSPEILTRLEKGKITNRPLAGTRRRGHDPDEDIRLEVELKNDPKELAEHLMLIDLDETMWERFQELAAFASLKNSLLNVTPMLCTYPQHRGRYPSRKTHRFTRATLPVGTLSVLQVERWKLSTSWNQ